jgi:hypothetical protein
MLGSLVSGFVDGSPVRLRSCIVVRMCERVLFISVLLVTSRTK